MMTLGISSALLLLSAGLMLTGAQEGLVAGGILAGAVFGAVGKVCHTLMAKSEADTPRVLIIVRFCFHLGVGIPVGCLGMILVLQWFNVNLLLLTSIAMGGAGAFFGHRIAKKAQPAILRLLASKGIIEEEKPKSEPPTTKIDETP